MGSALVEKRRALLINVVYYAFIIAVFYLILKVFFGIIAPFVFAFLVAAVLQRPVTFLNKKLHIGRGPLSALSVLLLLGIAGLLIFLLGSRIFARVKGFYEFASLRLQNLPQFLEDVKNWAVSAVGFLPDSLRNSATDSMTLFFDDLIENGFDNFSLSSLGIDWSSLLSVGAGTIKDTVVQIPSVIIAFIISIVASVFMTIEYGKIKSFVLAQVSEKTRQKVHEGSALAVSTLKKMLKAYSLIVLITTTELSIGLYILKFAKIYTSDYIIFIAIIIAIIDIIPVLGTGTVLIPWAVYSFITGSVSMGVGLVIIYAVILVIRQIIEPKLVAGQVGLSPIVTIISMYIGTKLLGVLGFFILPFIVILIKRFNDEGIIHLFKSSVPAEGVSAAPAKEPSEPVQDGEN
ncbi:MAG: sporulation integral membrane protein YtvI [Oscillospiraceae bacterium]|nr:sporulation integral membrane protein YtvI [Oscillospiraceae bacterium]